MPPRAARVAVATLCSLLLGSATARADALTTTTNDNAGAAKLATAMADPGVVTGTPSFVSVPGPTTTPNAVGTAPLGKYFPSQGRQSYAVLTTGKRQSLERNAAGYVEPNVGTDQGYLVTTRSAPGSRSTLAHDVSVLKVPVAVPAGANCLTFDFALYSAEFPTFVHTQFNDAFVAELDKTTWNLQDSTGGVVNVNAPDNFAFDAAGKAVSVNTTTFSTNNAAGTAYDKYGATPLLSASREVSVGSHDLYLSIFDSGDGILDSAVFLDALRVGFVPDPAKNCKPGAQPVRYSVAATGAGTDYVGDQTTIGATVKDDKGTPVTTGSVKFTVGGKNPQTSVVKLDSSGNAKLVYAGKNPGDDTISACYDFDGDDTCEANASTTHTWVARPKVSVGAASVTEGNAGTASVTVPVTLDGPATSDVTVAYTTSNGTAVAPGDFSPASATVTIPKGQTSASFTVLVNGDTLVEPDESFGVTLSNPTVAVLGTATASVTIVNDDAPTFLIAGGKVGESDGKATLTITSSLKSSTPLTVDYAAADGTAKAGVDYTATTGTATIPAGQTQTTVDVPVLPNDLVDGDRAFTATLGNPSTGGTITVGTATITITDDDVSALNLPAKAKVDERAGKITLTVAASLASTSPITVAYATADGTATAGADYTTTAGTLTIPAGAKSGAITIPVLDDTAVEDDETFSLSLGKASAGATISAGRTDVTIVSDDVAPTPTPTPTPSPTPEATPVPTPTPQIAVLGTNDASPPPSTKVVLCGQDIVLLDVIGDGGKVHVAGLAAARFAGQSVAILAGKKTVGKAQVATDGTFSADVPQPRSAARSTIRYTAKVGKATSRALKLERKLVITSRDGLQVKGRILAPKAKLPKTVSFYRRLTCTKQKQFATAKVAGNGSFTVALAKPAAGELFALFRVSAKIGNQQTFTLPIAVR